MTRFAPGLARNLGALCLAGPLLLASRTASAAGAEGAAPHLEGGQLTLVWALPFVGILLSIAVFPLLAPVFWHRNFGKVAAFWALAFLLPFAWLFGFELALFEVLHTALKEYIPFIILLLSLFTVAGGVRITGALVGTPLVNLGFLLLGTVLASWMGTTGAAMLLIRPVLRANAWRRYRVHVVVFFIFLVANIGGSLTPLGDPPLFLGFLKGVDFFWPTTHMLLPMVTMAVPLLAIFYAIDRYYYAREDRSHERVEALGEDEPVPERFGIEGGLNVLLLGGVVGAVLLSGVWESGVAFEVYHVTLGLEEIVRDLLLLALAFLSLLLTSRESRERNGFSWFPILEVAKLFAGIFVTIVPAIAMLRAGEEGPLSAVVNTVSSNGQPVNAMYFWITGLLSSFLDNAPTYLVFFNTAGGADEVQRLMGDLSLTLLAISAGAVFMGANTYIGNAPNFMVRSIAEEYGVKMPSFFGYMLLAVLFLGPLFLLVTFLFFL